MQEQRELAWPARPVHHVGGKLAAIDEGVTASSRRLPAVIAVQRKQVEELKRPTHAEVPEVARYRTADSKNDNVGGLVLTAPPQHPAGPEDRERDGAQFQPLGLIHDSAPMADIRCHLGR